MDSGTLEKHEAFLRAIFESPGDDLPRLVYADFLEEQGNYERAELLRLMIRLKSNLADERTVKLLMWQAVENWHQREPIHFTTSEYLDSVPREINGKYSIGVPWHDRYATDEGRERIVNAYSDWFAATDVYFFPPRADGTNGTLPQPITERATWDDFFSTPAFERVTGLNLVGTVKPYLNFGRRRISVFNAEMQEILPTVSSAGVAELASHAGAERLTELNLTYNAIDNHAARALIDSTYLTRLKVLRLQNGNSIDDQTWRQVLDRFGPDVAQ
jgi:uncharacterized protein (TIGR02996 family)